MHSSAESAVLGVEIRVGDQVRDPVRVAKGDYEDFQVLYGTVQEASQALRHSQVFVQVTKL